MSWKHFTSAEMSCLCCGEEHMDENFMEKLEAIREECGFPFKISSAYRCEKHNIRVGGKTGSAHSKGHAVDIVVNGANALMLVSIAKKHGFTGIGVSQRGPHNVRFIHLDDMTTGLRPYIWSY
jgi:zinc D-Ala-D-Ala carboxypeptidase